MKKEVAIMEEVRFVFEGKKYVVSLPYSWPFNFSLMAVQVPKKGGQEIVIINDFNEEDSQIIASACSLREIISGSSRVVAVAKE